MVSTQRKVAGLQAIGSSAPVTFPLTFTSAQGP
jgi:hypothetical protein